MSQTQPDLFAKQGQELGVGEWVEMTQDRVDAFAEATEDRQWIHVDAERAKDGPYGGTIAHGFLTLSLVLWLGRGLSPRPDGVRHTVNYGLNRVRFPAPVPVGSRIRARVRNLAIEEVGPTTVHVINEITVEIEGGAKPGCVAEVIARHSL